LSGLHLQQVLATLIARADEPVLDSADRQA